MKAPKVALLAPIMVWLLAGCSPTKPLDPLAAAQQMDAAAVSGDVAKGEALLKANPEAINATAGNAYGSTPLHFAAYNGRTEFAAWLLAHNADVNAVNKFGVMPLHDASSQGHKEIVAMILAKKPALDIKDEKGKTPLQYAIENGHSEVADILRQSGARDMEPDKLRPVREPASPPVPIVAPVAPQATWEIVGFYGAADNGGTFVRTVEQAPVKVGDRILVTGTGLYDGNWTVLQTFQYKDPMDPNPLWGYRIEPKWQGVPAGFTNDGSVPAGNAAKLQPLLPAEASKPM